jgi:hypothetical protein
VPSLGYNSGLNDTWTYSGGTWSLLFLNGCTFCGPMPTARDAPYMTYDAADGYILLFGGFNWTLGYATADTWEFAGGTWTGLTTGLPVSPPAGSFGTMAYDGTDGYVILYGGSGYFSLLNGTWNYSGITGWTQLSPSQNPGPDDGGSMAFDAKDSTIVHLTGSYAPERTWTY